MFGFVARFGCCRWHLGQYVDMIRHSRISVHNYLKLNLRKSRKGLRNMLAHYFGVLWRISITFLIFNCDTRIHVLNCICLNLEF